MPVRLLRDGILTSESVCSLTWPAEVFYRRLMSVADDHGLYSGNLKLLMAALYPLQLDKVSASDVGKWLSETTKAGLVRRYEVEGKAFVQILRFGQRTRSEPKYPVPPSIADNCGQLRATARLSGDGDECVCGDECGDVVAPDGAAPPKKGKKPKATDERAEYPLLLVGLTDFPGYWESYLAMCKERGWVMLVANQAVVLDTLAAQQDPVQILKSCLGQNLQVDWVIERREKEKARNKGQGTRPAQAQIKHDPNVQAVKYL